MIIKIINTSYLKSELDGFKLPLHQIHQKSARSGSLSLYYLLLYLLLLTDTSSYQKVSKGPFYSKWDNSEKILSQQLFSFSWYSDWLYFIQKLLVLIEKPQKCYFLFILYILVSFISHNGRKCLVQNGFH